MLDCKPIPNPTECNAKLGAQEGKVLEDEACKLLCHYNDIYARDHDTHRSTTLCMFRLGSTVVP